MANFIEQTNDDLVFRAKTQANALGQLYEIYYDQILRFCVHRLFNKEIAEDITSTVFLEVAQQIRKFSGRTAKEFSNWLYAIAINHVNSYIRKTSRRKKLFEKAASSITNTAEQVSELNWPELYKAILKLKTEHQTIITLRFFENLPYEKMSQILNMNESTLRVMVHRILNDLRNEMKNVFEAEV